MTKTNTRKNSSTKSAETSSYVPPKSPIKIPKGDKGFAQVKKAFKPAFEENENKFYPPPQTPVSIQPGDTGFITVGKGYNRFIWTFNDWYKSKKKIINPDNNWNLANEPVTKKEWGNKQKGLYL